MFQKGQRCGMYALLDKVDISMVFLCLLEEGGSEMDFLTVTILLRPQGTAGTNCLGRSVLWRLKGNRGLFTPPSSQTARGICSGLLIISKPEITYLSHQSRVLQKKMGVKLWLISSVCSRDAAVEEQ